MEEKKKRWRPSLTAYRSLEGELSEMREQCMILRQADSCRSDEMRILRSRLAASERSNTLLADEIERLRNDSRELTDENASLRAEVSRLKSRSLWKRIMDK